MAERQNIKNNKRTQDCQTQLNTTDEYWNVRTSDRTTELQNNKQNVKEKIRMLDATMSCQTQRLNTGTTDRMLERTLIDTTKQ